MEADKQTTMICTLLAMDHSSFCYRVCSVCERALPDNPTALCKYCIFNAFNSSSSRSKRLFRILVSCNILPIPSKINYFSSFYSYGDVFNLLFEMFLLFPLPKFFLNYSICVFVVHFKFVVWGL